MFHTPIESPDDLALLEHALESWTPIPSDVLYEQVCDSDVHALEALIDIIEQDGLTKPIFQLINHDGTLSQYIPGIEELVDEDLSIAGESILTWARNLITNWTESVHTVVDGLFSLFTIDFLKSWEQKLNRYKSDINGKTFNPNKAELVQIKGITEDALLAEVDIANTLNQHLDQIWNMAIPTTQAEYEEYLVDLSRILNNFEPVYGISLNQSGKLVKGVIEDPYVSKSNSLHEFGYTEASFAKLSTAGQSVINTCAHFKTSQQKMVTKLRAFKANALKLANDPNDTTLASELRIGKKATALSARVSKTLGYAIRDNTIPKITMTLGKLKLVYV